MKHWPVGWSTSLTTSWLVGIYKAWGSDPPRIVTAPAGMKEGALLKYPYPASSREGYLQPHDDLQRWSPSLQSLFLYPRLVQGRARFQPHFASKGTGAEGQNRGGLNTGLVRYRKISGRRSQCRRVREKLQLEGKYKYQGAGYDVPAPGY